jgi:dienelactone hydrolase
VPALTDPVLTVSLPDGPVRAVALVLHGGRETSDEPTSSRQLAVLRMRPFASTLAAAPGLAVARLRYRARGWNGELRSPVADTRWALAELQRRVGSAPVALVGHSMGGRTALHVADDPNVRAVAALAPWIERADPVEPVAGRRLLLMHGDRDRITSPKRSAAYASAAQRVARSVSYISVRDEKHAMLHRAGLWHELTTGYVLATMCDRPPAETVSEATAKLLAQALAGAGTLTV